MLKIIPIKNLIQFTEEVSTRQLSDIPITPLRALSQQKNATAHPDDPALIVAYNEAKEIVAYFGCLPDRIAEGPDEKVCWSSCWWGHPEKGKAATMQVFYQALKLWKGKMLFDALPEKSESILKHMGFFSFRKMDGMRGFLRFKWHKIIPARYPQLKAIRFVFSLIDFILNTFYALRIAVWDTMQKEDFQIKRINTIDNAAAAFISKHNRKELIGRGQDQLNWIIQDPWLTVNKNGTGPMAPAYFFSAYAKRFDNIILKVWYEKEMIAVLFMTLRDGELKLPYAYFEKEKTDLVAKVILQKMIEVRAETFVCFHKELLAYFRENNAPFYHVRLIDKTFGYSSELEQYMKGDVVIQDGDGDVVFT